MNILETIGFVVVIGAAIGAFLWGLGALTVNWDFKFVRDKHD